VQRDVLEFPALAEHFRVSGTPTFILLDPTGNQLTRFRYEPSVAAVVARIAPFVAERDRSADPAVDHVEDEEGVSSGE
jgi:hypothetical protein